MVGVVFQDLCNSFLSPSSSIQKIILLKKKIVRGFFPFFYLLLKNK